MSATSPNSTLLQPPQRSATRCNREASRFSPSKNPSTDAQTSLRSSPFTHSSNPADMMSRCTCSQAWNLSRSLVSEGRKAVPSVRPSPRKVALTRLMAEPYSRADSRASSERTSPSSRASLRMASRPSRPFLSRSRRRAPSSPPSWFIMPAALPISPASRIFLTRSASSSRSVSAFLSSPLAFLALMPMSWSISMSPFSPRAALTARSCRVSIRLASSSASAPARLAAPAYSCQLPVDRPTILANLLASAAAVAASAPRAKAPPPAAPNNRDRRPARAPRRSSPACPCCTMPWSLSRTLPMLPERRCRPVTLEKRPRAWRAFSVRSRTPSIACSMRRNGPETRSTALMIRSNRLCLPSAISHAP